MVSLSFVLCYKKNYEYDIMMVDRIEDGQMVERLILNSVWPIIWWGSNESLREGLYP